MKIANPCLTIAGMERLFVPYSGGRPATVTVNGDRLVIMSASRDQLEDELAVIGATKVRAVGAGKSAEEAAESLARRTRARVVLPPPDVNLRDLLVSLEESLPWIQ